MRGAGVRDDLLREEDRVDFLVVFDVERVGVVEEFAPGASLFDPLEQEDEAQRVRVQLALKGKTYRVSQNKANTNTGGVKTSSESSSSYRGRQY